MAKKYRYAGPGPVEDPDDHTIVRPGDERELDACPWGPWEPVEDGAESESAAPPTQAPADDDGSPAAASTAPADSKEG